MEASQTFISTPGHFDSERWGHHFRVPDEAAVHIAKGRDRRVVATFNGSQSHHCALMPIRGTQYFININNAARYKLGLIPGQQVQVDLQVDDSPYGMSMSVDFEEALKQEEAAAKLFHALSAGKQRALIYYADNVKSCEIK
jgi:hypothetical protein